MTKWIIGVGRWVDGYIHLWPYTPDEVLETPQYFLNKPQTKYIPVELNTNNGDLVFRTLKLLTQNELKSLYSCKKALTAKQLMLVLQNNDIA